MASTFNLLKMGVESFGSGREDDVKTSENQPNMDRRKFLKVATGVAGALTLGVNKAESAENLPALQLLDRAKESIVRIYKKYENDPSFSPEELISEWANIMQARWKCKIPEMKSENSVENLDILLTSFVAEIREYYRLDNTDSPKTKETVVVNVVEELTKHFIPDGKDIPGLKKPIFLSKK